MMRLMPIMVISVLTATGCNRSMDIEDAPIGAQVQVTREDGAVVEGTLAARDETKVEVKTPRASRTVARKEVADVQVVTPDNPPELPPIAKFREYVVPDGTGLKVTLETTASSETSQVGDRIEGKLTQAEYVDGVEVLPAGSTVVGTVSSVASAGKVKGRAALGLHFNTVVARGESYPISAGIASEAKSTKKKDAAIIGLPALGGAVIGGIAGGGKGAAVGAAIGGGAGTAVVLSTEGKPVVFGSGSTVSVTLDKDVLVRVPVK